MHSPWAPIKEPAGTSARILRTVRKASVHAHGQRSGDAGARCRPRSP
eukprot:CAMPEP_0171271258 /NCGR_PEP_ID=MMETSP0790-20130122/61138_1 /TAXON_ID=2925 /ORGANISM="Alexandrium catenella, Strain OF101" /LENGTH=46 /DNA_ID= /DNA_START= /DNA_END= /DNA_ORIENTATION=